MADSDRHLSWAGGHHGRIGQHQIEDQAADRRQDREDHGGDHNLLEIDARTGLRISIHDRREAQQHAAQDGHHGGGPTAEQHGDEAAGQPD